MAIHKEDRQLAKKMARGNQKAYAEFFDDYFPRVYRFCLRRLSEADAEEVTQSVLIDAVNGIDRYRGEASLFTWLCQMARYQISAHYKRQARRPALVAVEESDEWRSELESLNADPQLAPDAQAVTEQTRALIQLILDHLPGNYGRMLELKYMLGYSVDEIADELGDTTTAVQSRLARARDAFRSQYEAMEGELATLTMQTDGGRT